jgi:hypothetical protein
MLRNSKSSSSERPYLQAHRQHTTWRSINIVCKFQVKELK